MSIKPKPSLLPVVALLAGATMWGVSWYPLRLLEDRGLSGLWTTFVMFAAASAVGIFIMRTRWHELRLQTSSLFWLALANGWCNVAFILAILDGSVVRVLMLFYLSPIWATLLGYFFLGERLSRSGFATLGLAMLGALVMLWDPLVGLPWPQDGADWLAITSGMAFAVSNTLVRKVQAVSVEAKTVVAWGGVAGVAALALLLVAEPWPVVTSATLGAAAVLGVFGIAGMTYAVQYGVTHMPVHRSSVILLFEIVAGAVSSQLLSDEVVQAREWVGGAMIVVAGYMFARGARGG